MREMKDSGIEWIGNIPANWKRCKIKNVVSIIGSGTTPTSSNMDYYNDEDVNWIQSGDLYKNTYIKNTSVLLSEKALNIGALQLYYAPFIVIAMYGASVGNISISLIDACTNQACCVIKSNANNDLKFLFYWLSMCKTDFLGQSVGGGQPNISQSRIKNQFYYEPSKEEQQRIASFLDSKCSELDALSADIQKEIEILEKYKRSVITEAVTKGMNPDVEMKDSGIEWIGEIPENWQTKRIKYLLNERNSRSILGNEEPLSMSQKYGLIPTNEMENIPNMASTNVGAKLTYIDDLVLNKLKAHLGVFSVSKYMGLVSPDYSVYYTKGNCNIKYLEYLFKTDLYINEFKKRITGVGAGLSRLYTTGLFDIRAIYPPITEQNKIVEFINNKVKQIDEVIRIKNTQIETMSTYKKSLIYEYVTGKKEVG